MIHSAARYRRALNRKLRCSSNTRGHLLEQFDFSLSAFLEEHPEATEADPTAAFGTPKEMANVMMEEVSAQEKCQYIKKKRLLLVILGALAMAVFLFAIYVFFIKEIPVETYDWVYEETSYIQECSI